MKTRLLMMALLLSGVAQAERQILIVAHIAGEPSLHGAVPALQKALGDVQAGAALASAIDARIGQPPARLSPSALALLQARVKQSERNIFFNGSHVRESIVDLEDVRARLSDAQGSLAHDRDVRSLLHYVLVKLTRAYQIEHIADAGRLADARMEQLVRLFPDRPLDPEHNGRELCDLYDRVHKRLAVTAHVVAALPPGVQLFVEGLAVTEMSLLVPGSYRVFAGTGASDGRVHTLEVSGESTAVMDVPLELALHDDPSPSLTFRSPAARAMEETLLVARLGHVLGASRVYVVGASPEATFAIWAYDVGTGERARLVAAVGTNGSSPSITRLVERLTAELAPGSSHPIESRLILVDGPETVVLTRSTSTALSGSQAGQRLSRGLRALEVAGWTALAAGLPMATVGAALWPRGPGGRAGLPLVATGATLAMMGSDWTLVVAAIRGRREIGRAVASVAAVWAVGALVCGLSQLGH
jgi:hypothetical protein